MRAALAGCACLLIVCAAAFTAESPAQLLFDRLRAHVRDVLVRVPRYTCMQTVVRTQYRPQYGSRPNGCAAVIAAREASRSNGLLLWHDRLRLDVAVGPDSEMFSWAGARSFESGDLGAVALSGSRGSGDFAAFLASVFGSDAEGFRFQGEEDTPLGHLAVYDYTVPHSKSHYSYSLANGPSGIAAYGGSFLADPATAELKQLIVESTDFAPGEICRVRDTMDYVNVSIGSGTFLLPSVSRMVVLYPSGEETTNETHYSNCHEFTGESTIRFDEPDPTGSPVVARLPAKPLPPRTRIRVAIDPPVDSTVAAAGDPITAAVEREVKQAGQVLVRTTDHLHGRILRFEQFMYPHPYWLVAIQFDSIDRQGVEQPLALRPLDDNDRNQPRREGLGVFNFPGSGKLILDRKFRSEWETR